MATKTSGAHILMESRMHDAWEGDPAACFDVGLALSTDMATEADLVEAHKWFDLAAQGGYAPAEACRANIAWKLTGRQIAEAHRRARIAFAPHMQQTARFSASVFA